VSLTAAKFSPDQDVVSTALDSGAVVLLHLRTGHYFSLNETGAHIWNSMTRGLTVEEIGDVLATTYDVGKEQALRSTSDLLEELAREQLIVAQ
jgi:hypothetical protein